MNNDPKISEYVSGPFIAIVKGALASGAPHISDNNKMSYVEHVEKGRKEGLTVAQLAKYIENWLIEIGTGDLKLKDVEISANALVSLRQAIGDEPDKWQHKINLATQSIAR